MSVLEFTVLFDTHRVNLMAHCYRMLGSVGDADDAVQLTYIRAWKSQAAFEGRSAVSTWLHTIATRVCLDALATRKRRARPIDDAPAGTIDGPLVERPRTHWLEPVPDAMTLSETGDPAHQLMLRESVRLAFVAAIQHLPPRQRAALLLTDVLGYSAAEVAEMLETTVASIHSALQRARGTVRELDPGQGPGTLSASQSELVGRFVERFERYDVEGLTQLLAEDALLNMPPYALWLRGRETIGAWLLGRGIGCRGSRLIATAANGSPAFGQYRVSADGKGYEAWALVVLELDADSICGWTSFLDTAELFPRFELPLSFTADGRPMA